ncbi:MAG: hypothetical protein AAF204_02120 [Pseudomonadota bacterium]
MANQTPVKDDPKQLEEADSLWKSFIVGSKISIAICVFALIALALLFVPTGG